MVRKVIDYVRVPLSRSSVFFKAIGIITTLVNHDPIPNFGVFQLFGRGWSDRMIVFEVRAWSRELEMALKQFPNVDLEKKWDKLTVTVRFSREVVEVKDVDRSIYYDFELEPIDNWNYKLKIGSRFSDMVFFVRVTGWYWRRKELLKVLNTLVTSIVYGTCHDFTFQTITKIEEGIFTEDYVITAQFTREIGKIITKSKCDKNGIKYEEKGNSLVITIPIKREKIRQLPFIEKLIKERSKKDEIGERRLGNS